MDDRRNSASYSFRKPVPSTQTIPDNYQQKRSSYRRPSEPTQPTDPPQNESPVIPSYPPSNSSRQYAPEPPTNGIARSSSHRRRDSQQYSTPTAITQPPPIAPEAPRAPPPSSYKDPYAAMGSTSRSQGPARAHSTRSRNQSNFPVPSNRPQPSIQVTP